MLTIGAHWSPLELEIVDDDVDNLIIGMCGIGYAARQGTSTGFLSITARASHRPNYNIRIRQTDYNRYLTCHPRVQKNFYLPNLVILIEAGFWHTILIDSCNLLYENRKIYYHW